MRIYHNIPALTAYNSLNSTNKAMEKTIQKLSTGLRINSAADDAAGFAISEKMRSQISGLEVAIRNAQDATSMLQTAEGALGETNSMLQRMRELAVQASNDTLTSQDRSYIQLEIDQLADQIDRIAKTTQFNKKRLLDGSSAGITSSSSPSVKVYVNGSLRSLDQFGQKVSFEGNYRISVKLDPSQTGSGQVQKSSIMSIKHDNVITGVQAISENGVDKVSVNNLPAGDYTVKATDVDAESEDEDIAKASLGGFALTGAYGVKVASETDDDDNTIYNFNNAVASTDDDSDDDEGSTVTVLTTGGRNDENDDEIEGTASNSEHIRNNASILFEVTSVTDDSITLKATSSVLKQNGDVDNKLEDKIVISRGSTVKLGYKLGLTDSEDESDAFTFSMNSDASAKDIKDAFSVGNKFVFNFRAGQNNMTAPALDEDGEPVEDDDETTAHHVNITISGVQDKNWPDRWGDANTSVICDGDGNYPAIHTVTQSADGEGYVDENGKTVVETEEDDVAYAYEYEDGTPVYTDKDAPSVKFTLDRTQDIANKEIHFRNFYLNGTNGKVYDGDIILTTNDKLLYTGEEDNEGNSTSNVFSGDKLASFTAAYIGKIATSDTKLRDLNTFWNSSGVFMLDSPKTITITQGDGKQTSVTLYATDTVGELREKFNNAIANDLGQGQYVNGDTNNFCSFVEKNSEDAQGLETVGGTFIFRSVLPGSRGDLTFTGDEDLINTFAMNEVQSSSTAAFIATISDAHTGIPVEGAKNIKVADNRLIGVLHPNVDIEFDPMANISVDWSEEEKKYFLNSDSSKSYEAIIHIVDSSTVFQIGANEGEDIAIDIGNMSAGALGVTNINVSTREMASKAIGQIDAAINKVSTQRAKIGAYQNAIEYTSENLSTTMTNLTAAESRIRDADMAATMMEFVKLQILNQSGTSMLAQANQLPQSVLSLLQG